MKDSNQAPDTSTAILLVGDPGTRKTTLALHAPRPYIFDMDHNLAAPARFTKRQHHYDQSSVNDAGIPIPPAQQYKHLNECLAAAVNSPIIDTIILDSFTTLSDILIAEIRRQDPKIADPTIPLRIQDWGKFAYLFKEIIMRLRHTGKIIICIAHQKVEKDEADSKFKTFLNIPGNNANYISGLFTDVWAPFPHITGVGGLQKHEWFIRSLPLSENDHRGTKSSFGLKVTEPWDNVVKILGSLKTTGAAAKMQAEYLASLEQPANQPTP